MKKLIRITFVVIYSHCLLVMMVVASFRQNWSSYIPVNVSTFWENNDSHFPHKVYFNDDSVARLILLSGDKDPLIIYVSRAFGFGFFCNYAAVKSCYLSIMIVSHSSHRDDPPQVVWSANRNNPVSENATLKFSSDGDMILADGDGAAVWSAKTAGMSIDGIKIHKNGNFVLLDLTNGTIWQSFDHPTDTLLMGQILREEQRITSRVSPTNLSHGVFYLSIYFNSISAFVEGDKPTRYLSITPYINFYALRFVILNDVNITFYMESYNQTIQAPYQIPSTGNKGFLRLDIDGGLRIYTWDWQTGLKVNYVFSNEGSECQFPLKCGKYGVCKDGQCSCPRGVNTNGIKYFTPTNAQFPTMGCSPILASPSPSNQYHLVSFGHLSYFSYFDRRAAVPESYNEDGCKQACSLNPSCKAVFFKYLDSSASNGYCYMPTDVLSMIEYPTMPYNGYNTSSYLKVPQTSPSTSKTLVVRVSITFAIMLLILSVICSVFWWKRKDFASKKISSFELNSNVLVKFSYHDLCLATEFFSEKLGRGGFGAVFKGVLKDGTVVAVKRLDSTDQGAKEFSAEVDTVGNIHHINLVRLIGFCAEKSHRLLIYDYMSNGSLEKWIFDESRQSDFDWTTRHRILLDIAKGLQYLHEECRQQIVHLDVKPQNILLDDNFDAKLSDFGLSKLIGRDESQVVTCIRGTLGYIAPEWQHSRITVKADIYSYGVVLLEVVSGRKNLDYSRPMSDVHLLKLLERKVEEDRLLDIIDFESEDLQCHEEEIVRMIKLGIWCLNVDHTKRPSMSTVVKVLEGCMELETDFGYKFSDVIPPQTVPSTSVCLCV
ncbi:hypothetical protein GIB67_027030 [Kingdonia uniflora]|uniref:Receptor-like serine/threonine-protein kinase n=1 Tax=Kingdonia uniflora TaxID=39325 RepID=A0A7J7P1M4_9MAGN|nr:hypothetical protein GIB67_027030 [Kingdonia uniflora]